MGQVCTHMGAGAPGLTERVLNFHRTADKISDAAKRGDSAAVSQALTDTLAACTGCHALFKQEVVDDAAWAAATQTPLPTGPPPEAAVR